MMDVRAVLSAHHNHLIFQFSLSYLDYHQSIIYYAQFKYFLLLCFVGDSNYLICLIINCVPKLVQGCYQVMRLRQINKVFYSIVFYSNQRPLDSRTRTTTSMRFDLKFFRVFSKYRLLGKLHFTIFHKKIQHCYLQ